MTDVILHHRYYKINEFLLTCIGQWPYQTRISSRRYFTLIFILCVSQAIPVLTALVKYINQPDLFLDCISPFIIIVSCFTKLFTCIINSKNMLKLLNLIDEDWTTWACDREVTILHKYAKTGRNITLAYSVAVFSTVVLFITQPIVPKIIDVVLHNGTEPGEFPFPVIYYGFDAQKYYFWIMAYTYVCTSVLLLNGVASGTMFIVYVLHACGIFTAVGEKLMRLGESKETIEGRDLDYEIISTCIARHKNAIEFANLIETTYCASFFIVVGFNMIMLSVTGVQIFSRTNDPQDTIRFVAFIGIQMTHLFIESYISQILMDHSASIRDYIYQGKWYQISLRSQKLLNLMILRSTTPCKLTAGKICEMSVETYGAVVKTAMSYFTILRSMQ